MGIVFYDFTATWCGPCRIQTPEIEKIREKFGDKIEIKEIDVDENGELVSKYGITLIPTLILEKDGKIVKRFHGVTSASVLEKEIESLLR